MGECVCRTAGDVVHACLLRCCIAVARCVIAQSFLVQSLGMLCRILATMQSLCCSNVHCTRALVVGVRSHDTMMAVGAHVLSFALQRVNLAVPSQSWRDREYRFLPYE